MKLRQDTRNNFELGTNNLQTEDQDKHEVMMNISEINSTNFQDYLALGLKTLCLVILDYHANVGRIHRVLAEYRYNYMHYDRYPSLVLQIRLILDYFASVGVYSPQASPRERPCKDPRDSQDPRAPFDMSKLRKRVTQKINSLLRESGEVEKSFIDKKFEGINPNRDNPESFKAARQSNAVDSSETEAKKGQSKQSNAKGKAAPKKRSNYSSYYRDFNSIMYVKRHSFEHLAHILGRLNSLKNHIWALFQMNRFVETTRLSSTLVSQLKKSHWAHIVRNPEIFWLNINQ